MLQARCDALDAQVAAVERALASTQDAGRLRSEHMQQTASLLSCLASVANGNAGMDIREHGLSSAQEIATSSEQVGYVVC